MCLICRESQERIMISEGLFVITQEGHNVFFPVSGEILKKIPQNKRGNTRYEAGQKGVNVHRATAEMEGDFFANRKLSQSDFVFSIPAGVAMEILPNVTDHFVKRRHR